MVACRDAEAPLPAARARAACSVATFTAWAATCVRLLQVGQDRTLYGAQNARGLLFFEGLFLAFRCLFSSLFVFPQEHKMMVRDPAAHLSSRKGCVLLFGAMRAWPCMRVAFCVLRTPAETLPRNAAFWPPQLKERSSGMYRLSAFYLARTASDIPSDLSIPSLFIAIICEPARPHTPDLTSTDEPSIIAGSSRMC